MSSQAIVRTDTHTHTHTDCFMWATKVVGTENSTFPSPYRPYSCFIISNMKAAIFKCDVCDYKEV